MKKLTIILIAFGGVVATGSAIIYARSKVSHFGRDQKCINNCTMHWLPGIGSASKKEAASLQKNADKCIRKRAFVSPLF